LQYLLESQLISLKSCFRWGGKHFEYMGKAAPDGTLELCPEEALFLMESSSLGRFKVRIVVSWMLRISNPPCKDAVYKM